MKARNLLASQSFDMEVTDSELIERVLRGETSSFEGLVQKYQSRIFATVRRYSRRESDVEDIVQEIFLKAYRKLPTFRGEAPFEHWLMRTAVRTCYDYLRMQRRNREQDLSDICEEEHEFLEKVAVEVPMDPQRAEAARELVEKLMRQLSPAARLVITLLEIEDRSVKEISVLTGWSVPLVKVRAFRARAELKKLVRKLTVAKYL